MIQLGLCLWNQVFDWPTLARAATNAERLGYDHLWTWDHFLACEGDRDQPTLEPYAVLAAWATLTDRMGLGLLTGANTFRNPGHVAKLITTIDHLSGGRAILGMGGGWFAAEHQAFGLDFGRSMGERLDWLGESVAAMRSLLDGETVSSPAGGHYSLDRLRLSPMPVSSRLPILIGGTGERKTLRIVARYADLWNVMGHGVREIRAKDEVLRRHCDEVGRDPAEIRRTIGCNPIIRSTEREAREAYAEQMQANLAPLDTSEHDDSFWIGTPPQIAELMVDRKRLGFETFIAATAAPLDEETIERLIREVRPMVEAA
jgi:alkanesulfonate monooxygenase SsuD/methylene tetrahydromethanopterin reductase-like flavin-dependent oxidoreductase (luciferase family)